MVVEASGPRALGQGRTIHSLTLVDVVANAPGLARRFNSPFVGRERQSAELAGTFVRAARERTCRVLRLFGNAGVGKSRLVREFTGRLPAGVTVLSGRCLPYGEGITYWPLAEIVREITRVQGLDPGVPNVPTLAGLLAEDAKAQKIADTLAEVVGQGGAGGATTEETFWAVRRLFETVARSGPLVVVLDDLHWAEPTFLDLIDYVASFARQSALLLVCIARPELLEARPGWADDRANAASIRLEPLSEPECRELISNLLDRAPLPPAVERMIADAAEGNALFAKELVAMLVDEGLLTRTAGRWIASPGLVALPVPSSLHALLGARIDGLPDDERRALTTAAVEGVVFHRSAVAELAGSGPSSSLDAALLSLLRRDLIRRNSPDFAGEEAYRFRHVLIRDAAYSSLPKSARAELHERYATWLERSADERLREYEEIIGYHLERAFGYRMALGARTAQAAALADRARARLEAAGRRALVRTDLPAAIGLLERACRLLAADDPRRQGLLVEIAAALLRSGRLPQVGPVLEEAQRLAAAGSDECTLAHALIQQQFLRLLQVEEGGTEEAAHVVAQVVPVFERCGDDLGLCRALRLEAWLHWNEARAEAAAESWERAAAHARVTGDRHEYDEILTWIASSLWFGPVPAEDGIRRCESMRAELRESPEAEAAILRHMSGLHAMVGQFDLARRLLATGQALCAELGLTLNAATAQNEAFVELLAGNPAAAEASLREGYRALEEMGERAFRSTTAALLGRALLEQGRDAEAEEVAALSAKLTAGGDRLTQLLWRGVRARVLARRGATDEALTLAREAVAIAAATDFVNYRADALLDLSQVLASGGWREEAVAAATDALELYARKGNLVASAATRRHLGELEKM